MAPPPFSTLHRSSAPPPTKEEKPPPPRRRRSWWLRWRRGDGVGVTVAKRCLVVSRRSLSAEEGSEFQDIKSAGDKLQCTVIEHCASSLDNIQCTSSTNLFDVVVKDTTMTLTNPSLCQASPPAISLSLSSSPNVSSRTCHRLRHPRRRTSSSSPTPNHLSLPFLASHPNRSDTFNFPLPTAFIQVIFNFSIFAFALWSQTSSPSPAPNRLSLSLSRSTPKSLRHLQLSFAYRLHSDHIQFLDLRFRSVAMWS
ncbi:hypothetical protein Droror1_Dr00025525 [Drosera rotundifolia]